MNTSLFAFLGWPEIILILLVLLGLALMAGAAVALVVWLLRRNERRPAPPPPTPGVARSVTPPGAPCPRCGGPLPPNSPQGLCPRCVLGVGLATETDATGDHGPHGTNVVPPPEAEIARRFPHLEILGCLGHGGMGVVYKARQAKLNRLVALKILSPERGADPRFAERFLREAQALARLSHPNIVAVHDFGEADGMFFLLMEYVDGTTLRQLLREGRMKPEEALAIVPRICEALQFAHEQGVVHRDIKPENVLLDQQGRVKIADFGIAKLAGTDAPAPALTEDRSMLGTPNYMAPEQIEHPQAVDHRADIYSLGVVFYEMLTGELPLGRFQPPSQKVRVDVRLDEVVLHALEKEPERRYQQASQVKTDVETIAANGPKSAGGRDRLAAAAGLQNRLRGPAIGLIIAGILNWVAIPLLLLMTAYFAAHADAPRSLLVLAPLAAFVLSSVMIVAGLKMKQLEAYPLAIVGSILAMLITPGNLVGLPVGIWSLVVLCRRDVREAFGQGLPLDLLAPVAASAPPMPGPDRFWRRFAVAVALVLLAMIVIPTGLMVLGLALPALHRARERARIIQAEVSSEVPITPPMSVGFSPVREVILNDLDEARGNEALSFATGQLLSLPADFGRRTDEARAAWLESNRVDLLVDHARDRWALLGRALHFRDLHPAAWDAPQIGFGGGWPDSRILETRESRAGTLYLLPANAQPLLTFAFRTAGGDHGVLQITGQFTNDPRGMKLRYKLAKFSEAGGASAVPAAPTGVTPEIGALTERVLYSATAERPIKGEDLDAGREVTVPADVEQAGESQFFHWVAKEGVDLMAWSHSRYWTFFSTLKLASIEPTVWDTSRPEDLQTVLKSGDLGAMVRLESDSMEGFRSHSIQTNVALPLTFAFETRQGSQGVLQITGFTESPQGVRVRYKLTAPRAQPAAQSPPGPPNG